VITTVAGNGNSGPDGDGGPALDASLASPQGVSVDADGNVFIADTGNHRVRVVRASTGLIFTVAGNGDGLFGGDGGPALAAGLTLPSFVALGSAGRLFIADSASSRIRLVTPAGTPNLVPDCSAAALSTSVCWPPNHTFQLVTVVGVTDPDGDAVQIRITGVSQDEPVDADGSGSTCPDAVLVDADGDGIGEAAGLLCERAGGSEGRVYTVSFSATDVLGNVCVGSAKFCVPHDDSIDHVCAEGTGVFDSLICPDAGEGGGVGTGGLKPLSLIEFQALTPEPRFLRGDVNFDGRRDVSDVIALLARLYLLSGGFPCQDSADANDDGLLDVTDAVTLVDYLFGGGGSSLKEPLVRIGPDPTPDGLGCQ
jgi:hypothetical protein